MKKLLFISIGMIFLSILTISNESRCEQCSFNVSSISSLPNPIPNDFCLNASQTKCAVTFAESVTITLNKLIIGSDVKIESKPMEINVGGPQIIIKPKDPDQQFGSGPYCAITIKRSNLTIENIKFEDFSKGNTFVICTYANAKNIVMNKVDFSNNNGAAVWITSGSQVTIKNSVFNPTVEKPVQFNINPGQGEPKVIMEKNIPETSCDNINEAYLLSCEHNCGENSSYVNNSCACDPGYEIYSGTCLEKCKEGEKRDDGGKCVEKCEKGKVEDAEGKCINECPYDNTEKSESAGACVCINGFASYDGLNNVSCIKCGSYGNLQNGQCICDNGFHVSLDGRCVPDSLGCSDDDPNAILENEKCICKTQFAYNVDPNGKPLCEQIPCTVVGEEYNETKGGCASPGESACIEKGDEWDAEAGKCVGAESSGDCNCNFTGGEPTVAQALIPFIAVLFGTGGMVVWRKSRRS